MTVTHVRSPGSEPEREERDPRTAARRMLRPSRVVVALAALSIVASVIATSLLVNASRESESVERQRLADQRVDQIERRLTAYTEVLYGLRGLISIDGAVSPTVYRKHFASLGLEQRFPGIRIVGFAEFVPRDQLGAFADRVGREVRESGLDYGSLHLTPSGADQLVISRIEPPGPVNHKAFGFDLFGEVNRREAATTARDADAPAATAPVKLVQDPGRKHGFLIMLPVYRPGAPHGTVEERRTAFIGVVYAAFRVSDLMTAILGPPPDGDGLEIYDAGRGEGSPHPGRTEASLIYDSNDTLEVAEPALGPAIGRFRGETPAAHEGDVAFAPLSLPGRTWTLAFIHPDTGGSFLERWFPWILLFGSVVVACVVVGVLGVLSRSRARAVAISENLQDRMALSRAKEDFVATVSHELRTPLTAIRGALELLDERWSGDLPERGRRMVGMALTNTKRIARLVNDILDLERLGRSHARFEFRACDVGTVVEDAVELSAGRAAERGVRLLVDAEHVEIETDRERVLQVVSNLLDNAVKFSHQDGAVEIEVRDHGTQVCVTVRDFGRGVPDAEREAVFLPFHQVDRTDSRELGGTGLGLSICRELITGLGGEIGVRSPAGGGSEFWFTLPLRPERADAAQRGEALVVSG